MLEFVQKAGPLMWVIMLCSVMALAVFLERLLYFHKASLHLGDFLRGLASLIEKRNYAEALQECASAPGPVARVLHAVILRHRAPRSELKEIGEEAGQIEVPKLERNLTLLSTIAYGTPLLGLLGTIIGLLNAFQQVASHSGYATASDVASGVYQSLLTSAAALSVAIPAFVALGYLNSRVNHLMHDMERAAIEILHVIEESREEEKPAS